MERDRNYTFQEYKGEKSELLRHYYLDYDRYYEAQLVYSFLKKYNMHGSKILDYGCGVGDYGMFLISKGHELSFYDTDKVMTNFVRYRLNNKNLQGKILRKKSLENLVKGQDVVIFGEVLEHMNKPQNILQACLDNNVKVIVTTSYPYRTEKSYFLQKGHSLLAMAAIPKCKKILENNYKYEKPEGEFRIWHK